MPSSSSSTVTLSFLLLACLYVANTDQTSVVFPDPRVDTREAIRRDGGDAGKLGGPAQEVPRGIVQQQGGNKAEPRDAPAVGNAEGGEGNNNNNKAEQPRDAAAAAPAASSSEGGEGKQGQVVLQARHVVEIDNGGGGNIGGNVGGHGGDGKHGGDFVPPQPRHLLREVILPKPKDSGENGNDNGGNNGVILPKPKDSGDNGNGGNGTSVATTPPPPPQNTTSAS